MLASLARGATSSRRRTSTRPAATCSVPSPTRVVPGAALAIGDRTRIVELAGYGRVGWLASDEAVSPDSTLYDLASLTKAVGTTSATLLLVQDGRIRLDDPVKPWLPEFAGRWKERVTWRHLLTHTAGLPAGAKVRGRSADQRLENIIDTALDEPPGDTVQYSDVSFIVLWMAAERVAGEPLQAFLERRLWRPLGMRSTAVLARHRVRQLCAHAVAQIRRTVSRKAIRSGRAQDRRARLATRGSSRRHTIWRASRR